MKKALTALTAVSALGMAASANAALVNYSFTEKQFDAAYSSATAMYLGNGTGQLDTDTGIFTYNLNTDYQGTFQNAPGEPNYPASLPTLAHWNWTGTVQTGAAPSGNYTTNSCTVETGAGWYAAPVCASTVLLLGATQNLEGPPGYPFFGAGFAALDPLNFATAVGAETKFAFFNVSANRVNEWTLTSLGEPAAVPVPAAAWLFGSALAGLAGAARKRRARSEA